MALERGFGFMLLAASLTAHCQAGLKDDCEMETLRECGDDYVPYGKRQQLPVAGKDFDDKCVMDKDQIHCTLQFVNDCLDGLSETATLVGIKSLEKIVNSICNVSSEPHKGSAERPLFTDIFIYGMMVDNQLLMMQEYQEVIPCVNSVGAKISGCFQDLKGSLQRAVVKAAPNEVIPHTCCSYSDVVDCIGQALTPCEGVSAKDYLLGLFERVFGKVLKLVCVEHAPGSAACQALPKLPPLGLQDTKIENYVELFVEAAATIED